MGAEGAFPASSKAFSSVTVRTCKVINTESKGPIRKSGILELGRADQPDTSGVPVGATSVHYQFAYFLYTLLKSQLIDLD